MLQCTYLLTHLSFLQEKKEEKSFFANQYYWEALFVGGWWKFWNFIQRKAEFNVTTLNWPSSINELSKEKINSYLDVKKTAMYFDSFIGFWLVITFDKPLTHYKIPQQWLHKCIPPFSKRVWQRWKDMKIIQCKFLAIINKSLK